MFQMTKDEILRRLLGGESVDKICEEFSDLVNAAEKEYKAEKSKLQEKFDDACDDVAVAMHEAVWYYKALHPDCSRLDDFKWTAADVQQIIETTNDVACVTDKLIKGSANVEQDFQEVIHKFFKKYGIE